MLNNKLIITISIILFLVGTIISIYKANYIFTIIGLVAILVGIYILILDKKDSDLQL